MKKYLFPLCLFLILVFTAAAAAGSMHFPDEMFLGTEEINLSSGESVPLDITFDPADTPFIRYTVFPSKAGIAEVDARTNTLTALRPGTVTLLFDSEGHTAQARLRVTVDGGGDRATTGKSVLLPDLDPADLDKLQDGGLKTMLRFLSESEPDVTESEMLNSYEYRILAEVTPGTEDAQVERAEAAGLRSIGILSHIHEIILQGPAPAMAAYLANDPDLIRVREDRVTFREPDPGLSLPEESVMAKGAATTTLEGFVEELTSVSSIHGLGYHGEGEVIAVIDDAVHTGHPEFGDRVIKQICFGYSSTEGDRKFVSICKDHEDRVESAIPFGAYEPTGMTHGTMTASAAAGKGGIAPGAGIIAIAGGSQYIEEGVTKEACKLTWDDTNGVCYATDEMQDSTVYLAYEYLLGLAEGGQRIDVLNMSYGDEVTGPGRCDDPGSREKKYMTLLKEAGILPVAAAGNESDYGEGKPACCSEVISVGASGMNNGTAVPAPFTNAGPLTDFLAPGVEINMASFTDLNTFTFEKEIGTSFSAPIAAGSMLLLHQMFPNNSILEMPALMKYISGKELNFSDFGVTQLNFENIEAYKMDAPEVLNTEAGNSSLLIDCRPDAKVHGFRADVFSAADPNTRITSKSQAAASAIALSDLHNGQEYIVRLYKYLEVDGTQYLSPVTEVRLTPSSDPPVIKPRFVLEYEWNAPAGTDPSALTLPPEQVPALYDNGTVGKTVAALLDRTIGLGEYRLTGWKDDNDKLYTANDPTVTLTADMTLHGVWAKEPPMLRFVRNVPDNSNVSAADPAYSCSGTSCTITDFSPVTSGRYTQTGWTDNRSRITAEATFTVRGSTTVLYGTWAMAPDPAADIVVPAACDGENMQIIEAGGKKYCSFPLNGDFSYLLTESGAKYDGIAPQLPADKEIRGKALMLGVPYMKLDGGRLTLDQNLSDRKVTISVTNKSDLTIGSPDIRSSRRNTLIGISGTKAAGARVITAGDYKDTAFFIETVISTASLPNFAFRYRKNAGTSETTESAVCTFDALPGTYTDTTGSGYPTGVTTECLGRTVTGTVIEYVGADEKKYTSVPTENGKYTVSLSLACNDDTCEKQTVSAAYIRDVREPEPTPEPTPERQEFFRLWDEEDLRWPDTGIAGSAASAYPAAGLTLQIPSLDIAAELVNVPRSGSSWAVDELGAAAGLLEGSDRPGEGISLIAAHNHIDLEATGPFALLGSLRPGDRVFVSGPAEMQSFRVSGNMAVDPGSVGSILAGLPEKALVLVTCEDELPDGSYLHRRIVTAVGN